MMKLSCLVVCFSGILSVWNACEIDGAPLESNPSTDGDQIFNLNINHPALGYINKNSHFPTITHHKNLHKRNITHRVLEASTGPTAAEDIKRLEEHFKKKLYTNVRQLPRQFEFSPWPGSYWPIYRDGINFRWNGIQSPVEKYAQAFQANVLELATKISSKTGILAQQGRQACTSDVDCLALGDKSKCGIRAGEVQGVCIPEWFGICHAWAPASVLEPEPKCAVDRNGVRFEPLDIKGLISQAYDGSNLETIVVGTRFDGDDAAQATKDQYGRFTNDTRRDVGAGLFHIALTNVAGIHKMPVIVDTDPNSAVWNHPIRSFEVLQMGRYSPSNAARQFFQTQTYPFNNQAKSIAYVQARILWVVESEENGSILAQGRVNQFTMGNVYEYILELDANDNIIGGEWVNLSKENHPDFLWFPLARPKDQDVTDVGLNYGHVHELVVASANC